LHKGYSGAILVIPRAYDSFPEPGRYVTGVIRRNSDSLPIGVFTYDEPDTTRTSPFEGRIACDRPIGLHVTNPIPADDWLEKTRSATQWAHLREGSSEPDAFFKYLRTAKTLIDAVEPTPVLPVEIANAANLLRPSVSPIKYLSNSTGDAYHDLVWRHFWFQYVLTDEVTLIWSKRGRQFEVKPALSRLLRVDGRGFKVWFAGRSDSPKDKIVAELNAGRIDEETAWRIFAENVHNRAHSYREDIDSGLEHLGLIESDGRPSELGYKFVDACERSGDPHRGPPRSLLASVILKQGNLGAFIHYIYKLSEQLFRNDPLRFAEGPRARLIFDRKRYLDWLRDQLANNLRVMNTSALRGGLARSPFQGELAILRSYGLVGGFRIGVGLEIDWPLFQEFLEYEV
jgi:hypothetical protein